MENMLQDQSRAARRAALFHLRRMQTAACVGATISAGLVVLVLKAI
ncbi:hypothetical protein ACFQUU_00860 [Herbaspirillum sp. GCM10030257]|jgi:hypothetical protein